MEEANLKRRYVWGKVATSLDPKGIEHKHVNQATLPSAKNSFDTDNPLLDLNEAGSADGDDKLFDEDIGTGDPKTRTGGHIRRGLHGATQIGIDPLMNNARPAEGQHSRVKRWLSSSRHDLFRFLEACLPQFDQLYTVNMSIIGKCVISINSIIGASSN
jgi:hypothetical protein